MSLDQLLTVVLIVTAAGYLLLAVRLAAAPKSVGVVPVAVLFVVFSIWVAGGAVELLATNFATFSIGRTGHFVGTALVPIVALIFFREYAQLQTRSSTLLLLSIIPLISIGLAATNVNHEFMWYLPVANDAGEFLTRPERWGPWFMMVHLPYSYLLIGFAILGLMRRSSAVPKAQRRGMYLLAAACVVPLSSTLAYDLGYGPNTLSYVPFFLAACLPAYAWLIYGAKLFDLAPLSYEAIFQNIVDPVIVVDGQYCLIGLNRGAERMIGRSESQALRQPLDVLLGDHATSVFMAMQSGSGENTITANGRKMLVQVSDMRSGRNSGSIVHLLMFRDVTETQEAQDKAENSDKYLNTIIDYSGNGIVRLRWIADEHGDRQLRVIFANAAAGRYLDVQAKSLVDKQASSVIRQATAGMDPRAAADVAQKFEAAAGTQDSLDIDVKQSNQGDGRWLRMICEPVGKDIAVTFVETTDRKAKELQMESFAAIDTLTGILNRRGFDTSATQRLADRGVEDCGALLFIDLNGFKLINDRFGHEVGDEILRKAAQRVNQALRGDDIIGRLGGDEFVALVPDVDEIIAGRLAMRLTEALAEPYNIGGQSLDCPASLGLALYPKHAGTLSDLLKQADQAMYRAKARAHSTGDTGTNELLEKAS
ncbi:MAG: diguanylate cyclase [Gammaproteobacteria bacterium]|nr:diguanylate cyclase [Gammaproteobacteria bacterium]